MPQRDISIRLIARDEASKVIHDLTTGALVDLVKATGAAVTALGSLETMKEIFQSSLELANKQEEADARLAAAIRNVGGSTTATLPHLKDFAIALSRQTEFTDDSIEAVQTLLISLGGLTGGTLDRATRATLDLAKGMGIELTEAAKIVAKAGEGATSSLKRFGIVIDQGATTNEKFAQTLSQIESKFGGMAQAAEATAGAKFAQVIKSWHELEETFGLFVTQSPVVKAALDGFATAINDLNDRMKHGKLDEEVKGITIAVAEMAETMVIAARVANAMRLGVTALWEDIAHGGGSGITGRDSDKNPLFGHLRQFIKDQPATDAALQDVGKELDALITKLKATPAEGTSLAEQVERTGKVVSATANELAIALAAFDRAAQKLGTEGRVEDALKKLDKVYSAMRLNTQKMILDNLVFQDEQDQAIKKSVDSVINAQIAMQRATSSIQHPFEFVGPNTSEALRVISEQMKAVADANGVWNDQLDETSRKLLAAAKEMDSFRGVAQQTFDQGLVQAASSFGTLMVDAAFGAKVAWGDALKGILHDLASIIIKTLIERAILVALGVVTGGAGAAAAGGSAGSGIGFAEAMSKGGLVGLGTAYAAGGMFVPRGTDIIPAMLTRGESVLTAGVTHDILGGRAKVVPAGSGSDGQVIHVSVNVGGAQLTQFYIRNSGSLVEALDHIAGRMA